MSLWDQLLAYANSKKELQPPYVKLDLWETSEMTIRLLGIAEALASRFEALEKAKDELQAQVDRLSMQVEVLQAHRERTRREEVKRSVR